MVRSIHKPDRYFAQHSGQLPALGKDGQEKLGAARVHLCGTGRIGTGVALSLVSAGIGYLSANDPQTIESDNVGPFVFARSPDIGRAKTTVLARFFAGRQNFAFAPLVAPAESESIDPFVRDSTLVISCANTMKGRLAAEQKAIRYRKPIIQVAAFDGRERLGGLITLKLPENAWSACFACYFAQRRRFPRGEGLLSTVTSALASIAAHMGVTLIAGTRSEFLRQHNLFYIDLESYQIEPLAVERRKNCEVCGGL